MKEHPVLGMIILIVIIWVSTMVLQNFQTTQEFPGLSLYAFYSICVQDGATQLADESCRRELVDGQNWGLLPLMIFGAQTPAPPTSPLPSPTPHAPMPTGYPAQTSTPAHR